MRGSMRGRVEALEELRRVFPTRHWNWVAVDIDLEMVEGARPRILGAIYPCVTQMDFNIGAALWCHWFRV